MNVRPEWFLCLGKNSEVHAKKPKKDMKLAQNICEKDR